MFKHHLLFVKKFPYHFVTADGTLGLYQGAVTKLIVRKVPQKVSYGLVFIGSLL